MRIERLRQSDLAADLDVLDADDFDGAAAFLAITTSDGAYPTTASAVYAVRFQAVDCAETEGAAATYVDDPADPTRYALNVGSKVPPSGTRVVVHAAGGRLVFSYNG